MTDPSSDAPTSPDTLDQFIARLPKAELHLHLEGSVEPDLLRDLGKRNGLHTADWELAAFERVYQYEDFPGFLRAFKFVSEHLKTPADYEAVTRDLARKLAGQRVSYAEVILSVGVLRWLDRELEPYLEAVNQGAQAARRDFGIKFNWIFDATRQFGVEAAREVARLAARFRDRGVVAFGIGGDEAQAPPELFRDVYRMVRDEGLHSVAHAGEAAGPESVRGAIEVLGAERIGHGLRAASDPGLLELLADREIPLEVCLSSNVATGVLDRVENHPLPQLLLAGVPLTLNTDDPAMFRTDLNREYRLAARTFGLTKEQLSEMARNGFRFAFEKNLPGGRPKEGG